MKHNEKYNELEELFHLNQFNRRELFLKTSYYLLLSISIGYTILWYLFDTPIQSYISLATGIITFISYKFIFKKLEQTQKANLFISIALFYCFISNIFLYKYFKMLVGYYIFIPMASLLLLDRKSTIKWSIISSILLGVSFFLSYRFSLNISIENDTIILIDVVQGYTIFIVISLLLYLFDLHINEYIQTLTHQSEIIIDSREELRQNQKYKERFFSKISHELRTPMNAIKGISELLMSKKGLVDQEDREYYEALNTSSSHLLSIVNNILDLGKIDEDKLALNYIDFNLEKSIMTCYDMVKYRAIQKNINIRYLYDNSLPKFILGDPIRFNQIILNILSNAVKFTEKGEVLLDVKHKIENGIQYVLIIVQDTGIGIAETNQDSIFDRFSNKNNEVNYKFGGTGLGLSIAKSLVEIMDGKIWFESKANMGSTFYIQLPIIISRNKSLDTNEVKDDSRLSNLENIHILIVDDNQLNLMVAERILQKIIPNVNIQTAENGKIALEILEKDNTYDIILMDIQMPIMDGIETTRIIKENPILSQIPIIAMTASNDKNEIDKGIKSGMSNYISKPFESKRLVELIEQYIQKK